MVIQPARSVAGTVTLPGDKSISHRYAMLASIAEGTSVLENYSDGMDCASTLECMRALGCEWVRTGGTVEIHGRGPVLRTPVAPLDCGNSGSTMRMLSGILAGQSLASELIGDQSLARRPMARVMAPLRAMGAEITAGPGDRPPLRIRGGRLRAIDYEMPVASAQVKTAVLFAGLFAGGETRVTEPLGTRDHGELALRAFGVEIKREGRTAAVSGSQKLRAIHAFIPGDISSAAFFVCAAALFPGSQLVINGLLMNPTRARFLDVMMQLGAKIAVTQLEERLGELVGSVQVSGKRLAGGTIAGGDSAKLIDELPVLAAIAPFTEDGIEIRDAGELRVKESDRIGAVAANLRAMGGQVEERPDGLMIPGQQSLHGAAVDSMGDHRIAMAFSIAALRAQGETKIHGAKAADISYPGFFATLANIVER
ncbi:MAG TPA: 3-phosphoshikimate 1-carboxyvinyltransferase [Terriglobales bacterium]